MVEQAALTTGLARGFEAVGDRWGFEIIRLVAAQPRTFTDLSRRLELTDLVLTSRLRHLTARGLLLRTPSPERARSWRYSLTEQSRSLWTVYLAMWTWDRRWCESPDAPGNRAVILHRSCANTIVPALGCGQCGAIGVTASDTRTEVDEQVRTDLTDPASKRIVRLAGRPWYDAAAVIGDSWSTALLAAALLGARRFGDIREQLVGVSSATLTDKLGRFVDIGLLARLTIPGQRRAEYRVTNAARDFFPIFAMFEQWARQHTNPHSRSGLAFTHTQCGKPLDPRYTCNACNDVLDLYGISIVSPGHTAAWSR